MAFIQQIGVPGFLSVEELAANPYAGPRIVYGEYILNLYSILALIKGQVVGWIESTGNMSFSATPQVKDYIYLFHTSEMQAACAS